ncbi:MAG: hypothetical protein V3S69_06050, partial [Dehalococcoidales bacterium]
VRNATSGALSTIRRGAELPGGDIQQVKQFEFPFPYSVECKHHKEFKIEHLIFERRRSKVYKAWLQCLRDAEKERKIPMMVFRANYANIMVVFNIEKFNLKEKCVLMDMSNHYCITKKHLIVSFEHLLSDSAINICISKSPTMVETDNMLTDVHVDMRPEPPPNMVITAGGKIIS